MFYDDLVQGGYWPLRHHDTKFDLQFRFVRFACRMGGPDKGFGAGYDDLGVPRGASTDWGGEETHGDVTNWGLWGVDPAGTPPTPDAKPRLTGTGVQVPAWAQVWATVGVPDPTGPQDQGPAPFSGPDLGPTHVVEFPSPANAL